MTDNESDPEEFDLYSPLSTSVHGKALAMPSPPKSSSSDRLYSTASPYRNDFPESEQTALLGNREGSRSYISTPQLDPPEFLESIPTAPRPLGILTRKISRVFQSKAYDYD